MSFALNNIKPNNEIDLLQLIEWMLDGKWKIISAALVCLFISYGFQVVGPKPSFVATTEIKPIPAVLFEDYHQSNALEFFTIYRNVEERDLAEFSVKARALREFHKDRNQNRDTQIDSDSVLDRERAPSAVLYQIFVEELSNRTLLAEIFKKHNLIVRDDFENEKDYEFALKQLAATVSIKPPKMEADGQILDSATNMELQFVFNDQSKWLNALSELKITATQNVRETIKTRFNNLVASSKQKRTFEIEDIDAEISSLVFAYDIETKMRLAHLSEQAAIARALDIAKQTNIPKPSIYQTLSNPSDIGSEVDTALYLRGYEALEKEIEVINLRQNKQLHPKGLIALEQEKLIVSKDKTPERAEKLFAETPVMNSEAFQAVSFEIEATNFVYTNSRKLFLAIAAVIGGMIGVVYVILSNAMRSRKEADVK